MIVGSPELSWSQRLQRDGEVAFFVARRRLVAVLAGCATFVLLGLALTAFGRLLTGLLGVTVFGAFMLAGFSQLLRRGPAVVVRVDGIHFAAYRWRLAWTEIERVSVWDLGSAQTIVVEVSDSTWQRLHARSSAWMRMQMRANNHVVGVPHVWLPNNLTITPKALSDWLAHEVRRRGLAQPG